MLNKISFCAKPVIHDYYPIGESVKELSSKAKKSAEELYTRFDGINQEAKAERSILKKQVPPEAGSNVHLRPKEKEAVDSVNAAAAANKYEQFSSF